MNIEEKYLKYKNKYFYLQNQIAGGKGGKGGKDSKGDKKPDQLSTVARLALQQIQRKAEEDARIKALQEAEDARIKALEEAEDARIKAEQEAKLKKAKDREEGIKAGIIKSEADKKREKKRLEYLERNRLASLSKSKLSVEQQPNVNSDISVLSTTSIDLSATSVDLSATSADLSATSVSPSATSVDLSATSISPNVGPSVGQSVGPIKDIKKTVPIITEFTNRSPIICIMGHVDAGKTSLIDKIADTRYTHGEIGNITQQITTTQVSYETLLKKIEQIHGSITGSTTGSTTRSITGSTTIPVTEQVQVQIPGILVIDTPGHNEFKELREIGASASDITIIVIDINKGLQAQTIQSIEILRLLNKKFIIALNKIDRIQGWVPVQNRSFGDALSSQSVECKLLFNEKLQILQRQIFDLKLGRNIFLYSEDDNIDDTVLICPISAETGEGISDLLMCLIKLSQTRLSREIIASEVLKCIVLDVVYNNEHGILIDAIIINGTLNIGDTIIISTINGLVTKTITQLLKLDYSQKYIKLRNIKGTNCVKIVVNDTTDLINVITGTSLNIGAGSGTGTSSGSGTSSSSGHSKAKHATKAFASSASSGSEPLGDGGVGIYASSLNSMNILSKLLHENNHDGNEQNKIRRSIPVSKKVLGNVTKQDLLLIEQLNKKSIKPEYLTILAINVLIPSEEVSAKSGAKSASKSGAKSGSKAVTNKAVTNIQIFSKNDIYFLFREDFKPYVDRLYNERKQKSITENIPVFPCIFKYNRYLVSDDIRAVIAIDILEGKLFLNTHFNFIPSSSESGVATKKSTVLPHITKVVHIEKNSAVIKKATLLDNPISIELRYDDSRINPRKVYSEGGTFSSKITINSMEALMEFHREELTPEDIILLKKINSISGSPESSAINSIIKNIEQLNREDKQRMG